MATYGDYWGLTPFEQWVREEGIPVVTQADIPDINSIKLEPWERTGCSGAWIDVTQDPLEGALVNNQGTIGYVCEIPPGGTFKAEKHIYEEIFYVLKGRGATAVWVEDGPRHTFEWAEGACFSIPLNAWHELYNSQGDEPVLLFACTNAPTTFNLYTSKELVFNNTHVFDDRFNPTDEQYFHGDWTKVDDRFTETNFISDVRNVPLDRWSDRGPGANMMFLMAGGNFICHVSEFPVGSYKKAHSHHVQRAHARLIGAVYILLIKGEGYDLQWPPNTPPVSGEKWDRYEWREGTLIVPGTGYHQHFNTSSTPSRYMVLRYGNPKYSGAMGARYKRTGGEQIEFEDEDPEIRRLFIEELKTKGIEFSMAG